MAYDNSSPGNCFDSTTEKEEILDIMMLIANEDKKHANILKK